MRREVKSTGYGFSGRFLTPYASRLDLLSELWHDLEEVAHQPVVGDLEDRRLGILVDGDNHLAVLHPREVLDRPGNADGDVELGGDDLAGLPDLVVVRAIARVDRRARR